MQYSTTDIPHKRQMAPDTRKQTVASPPPSPHPSLIPPPLFSSHPHHRPSRDLPHLPDAGADEPSVADYERDDVFWNSALEERDGEGVPAYDDLGSVQGTGTGYWVRELGLPCDEDERMREAEIERRRGTEVQDLAVGKEGDGAGERQKLPGGGPVELDFTFGEQRGEGERSVSPSLSMLSSWDLYKPPTPPWSKRESSLRKAHFEPASVQHDAGQSLDVMTGEREYAAREMRGGGRARLISFEPLYAPFEVNLGSHTQHFGPFEFKLPPNVLGNVEKFAKADPVGKHRVTSTAGLEPLGGYARGTERSGASLGETTSEVVDVQGAVWEGDTLRSNVAELEQAYLYSGLESAGGDSEDLSPPESLIGSTPEGYTLEEAMRKARTANAPGIKDHPAFKNEKRATDAKSADSEGERELTGTQEQKQIRSRSKTAGSGPPRKQGCPVTIEDEWPLDDHRPPPPGPNSTLHSPSPIRPSSASFLPPPPRTTLPTEDEAQAFIHLTHSRTPSPTTALPYYTTLLAAQASSIGELNALIADLTDRGDYYEHDLLPRTLAHWTEINTENHKLSTALRSAEQENSMLRDMLEVSRRTLNLCWKRETAVLATVQTMWRRKINRTNCAILERLVNNFGAGRGGGRGRWRWRTESPFREDVEQLWFVCEQNLKVLDEDLKDWEEGVRILEEMSEETRKESAERADEDGKEGERVGGNVGGMRG
ncbi:uncharacterized protein CC84DRAFT_1223216 [Paraphaeosphaeria sporulosa]|uniref:Uncharacterized protein n=1 Tax=Paraphaeosphaeria sporulosa TaxID=1460663 RepID=A0A177BUE5_9PLEO|nr:uncharacterized protein CC84DRAFT_1223216 [Paraphaeosphaeria sporulosa]OAF98904.1 hypothetical protein CC84DRAFT_1223216 [Paraphaeosphaeria sporulosa]